MQQASLIKITKNVNTKLDLIKNIIRVYLCFNEIKLSETEVSVLSYFVLYGINTQTKNLIVKSNICKNINNVKTVMVKLKKYGLIYKDDFSGKVLISKNLSFDITPTVAIYLKLDNKV